MLNKSDVTLEVTNVNKSIARHYSGHRKLTPKMVKCVLQMTLAGYTDDEILNEIKEKWNITVTSKTLYYQRVKHKDDLFLCEKEQLKIANVRSPYMQLSTRMASIQRAIEKELAKKRPSAQGLSMLYTAMETMIKNAKVFDRKDEELDIKREELKQGKSDASKNEYLADIERRSRNIESAIDAEYKIIDAGAGEELEKKKNDIPALKEDEGDKNIDESDNFTGRVDNAQGNIGEEALIKQS
jgi:hypothetical protein